MKTEDAPEVPGRSESGVERAVGRLDPKRDLAGMTTGELRAEIARLQGELTRRMCGDPVQGLGLTVGGQRL